uniref:Uncharacterized protein n=3 Tax=Micrurus TaxID=8634 RepID=A0A2D4IEX6_MICLE
MRNEQWMLHAMFVKSWIKCQQLPAHQCMLIDTAAISNSSASAERKQDVQNLHPILQCFNARPDTMCNNVGVSPPFCLYIIVTYQVHPCNTQTHSVSVKSKRDFVLLFLWTYT